VIAAERQRETDATNVGIAYWHGEIRFARIEVLIVPKF
jgi:hypothetical protein